MAGWRWRAGRARSTHWARHGSCPGPEALLEDLDGGYVGVGVEFVHGQWKSFDASDLSEFKHCACGHLGGVALAEVFAVIFSRGLLPAFIRRPPAPSTRGTSATFYHPVRSAPIPVLRSVSYLPTSPSPTQLTMAAPPRPVPPYLRLRTPGFAHHGLKFSPYFDGRAAIASGANFGLVGNGRVHVVQTTPAGLQLENV